MDQQGQCNWKCHDNLPYFYRETFGHIFSVKVNNLDHSLKDKEGTTLITSHDSSYTKIMFSQVCVSHSIHRGRVSLPSSSLVPVSMSFLGGRVFLVPCSFQLSRVSGGRYMGSIQGIQGRVYPTHYLLPPWKSQKWVVCIPHIFKLMSWIITDGFQSNVLQLAQSCQ